MQSISTTYRQRGNARKIREVPSGGADGQVLSLVGESDPKPEWQNVLRIISYQTTLTTSTDWTAGSGKVWTFTFATPIPTSRYNATVTFASINNTTRLMPYIPAITNTTLSIGLTNCTGAMLTGTISTPIRAMVFYW
jgi:hypothetical protein